MTRRGPVIPAVLLGAALVAFLAVLAWAFPIDMDELLPYHPIACLADAQQLNTYTSACGSYPTSLGPIDFQRAFNYIGVMPALLMLPVFSLSPWVDWHLLAGIVALVVAAVGIAVSLGTRRAYALVAVAWLPLALATIHDTGPIRLSLLALAWTPALLHRFTADPRRLVRLLTLALIVLLWLVATESKPFFLYLTPGIAVWATAALEVRQRGFVRAHLVRLAVAVGIAGVSSLALLLVLTVDGRPYLLYLAEFGSPNSLALTAGVGMTFLSVWPMTAQRFSLQYPNVDAQFPEIMQGPANALPLSADRGAPLSLALLVLALLAVVALLGWAAVRVLRSAETRSAGWWLVAATAALYLGAVASRGGSVHHFVFAQVPLVALVVVAARQAGWTPLRSTATVLVVSTVSLAAILAVPLKPEVSRDIDLVMSQAIDQAGPGDVVNCQSWGCYYRYALENRNAVPILWAETPDQQADLATRVSGTGGAILHVCRGCDREAVETSFTSSTVTPLSTSEDGWSLFEVQPQQ